MMNTVTMTDAGVDEALEGDGAAQFFEDMAIALGRKPHCVSPKYFYDERGSALFDLICEQPEYYPMRSEMALLSEHARDIAGQIGAGAEIIEFGAGSLRKIRLLLHALERPARYVPIDISGEHLAASARSLRRDFPGLDILPVIGDYTASLNVPPARAGARRVGFFPGSTLGNLDPDQALAFLRRAGALLRGGGLLLGVDMIKDPAVLHAAYNDAAGATAAFNLNLLARANRELGTDFDLSGFAHAAFYNAPRQRVEMHLLSLRAQRVHLGACSHSFAEGETLHTENSYKYTLPGLRSLAARAGLRPGPVWLSPGGMFSLHWLEAPQRSESVWPRAGLGDKLDDKL